MFGVQTNKKALTVVLFISTHWPLLKRPSRRPCPKLPTVVPLIDPYDTPFRKIVAHMFSQILALLNTVLFMTVATNTVIVNDYKTLRHYKPS